MKNLLIVLAVVAVPFVVSAQQFKVKGAGTSLDGESSAKMPNGDMVVVGDNLGSAFIARYNSSGILWMKKVNVQDLFPPSSVYTTSRFLSVACAPNGDIVAVGFADDEDMNTQIDKGLVARFDQDGNVLWSKTLTLPNSTTLFYDVAEDPSTGNVFVAGSVDVDGSFTGRTEILAKFGQDGSVSWVSKLGHVGDASQYGMRALLKNDSVLVFGEYQLGSYVDVTMSIYRKSDGARLDHFMYDFGGGTDKFCDAIIASSKVFFAFQQTSGGSSPTFVRLGSNMHVSGDPFFLYATSGASLLGCKLATRGSSIFCSGRVTSHLFAGVGSYAARLDLNLSSNEWFVPAWGRRIAVEATSGVNSPFKVFNNGSNILFSGRGVGLSGETEVVSTFLNSSGNPLGVYCDTPQNLDLQAVNFPTFYSNPTARNQSFPTPILGSSSFVDIPYDFTNCGEIILPVELVSFTGERAEVSSLLSWKTATEQNVSHFSVQRSVDGEWKEIGIVSATGNSQHLLGYEFVDDAPLAGDNYYRLETVDTDGSTEFSDVVVVHFDGLGYDVSVFPNPSVSGDPVTVKGEFQSVVAVDQLGRNVPVQRNGNQLKVQAGPGVYLLTFTDASGVSETVWVVTQ